MTDDLLYYLKLAGGVNIMTLLNQSREDELLTAENTFMRSKTF